MAKFVDQITGTQRHPRPGTNGNPRWWVHFQDHDTLPTQTDGSVGYGINNREYRDGPVEVWVERGQVVYIKVIKS